MLWPADAAGPTDNDRPDEDVLRYHECHAHWPAASLKKIGVGQGRCGTAWTNSASANDRLPARRGRRGGGVGHGRRFDGRCAAQRTA